MSDKTEKRDMDAIRAAYKLRMAALKSANQRARELENQRKLALWRKIEEKEAAEKNRLDQCIKTAKGLVKQHIDTLVVKYAQLVQPDDYGNVDYSKWESARSYFISKVIYPSIGGKKCGIDVPDLEKIVDGSVKQRRGRRFETFKSIDALSPIEYEMYCAAQLNRVGWKTVLTKTSGDQGVDVVADKGKLRLAIQCKKYSGTVGNAAVQEICAGMQFVQAQFGAVISNAPYTTQAKQLARSTNVLLLHHSDLARIESLLKKFAV